MHPGVARRSSWLDLGIPGQHSQEATWLRARVQRGGLYLYNTLTCVGCKRDAQYYVVWAVGLNPSLTLS